MKVQLIVVRGKPEGKVIPLAGPTFKIGRGETCHLRPNSEQVSRELAEFTLQGGAVIVRDLDGTIRFWNQGATELYGWSRDEAVGKSSHALLRTQFPRPLADTNADLLHRGPISPLARRGACHPRHNRRRWRSHRRPRPRSGRPARSRGPRPKGPVGRG